MFEDQNQKIEDIFSVTDTPIAPAAPGAVPAAPAPVAAPLGPPSALSQGKLQPARPSAGASVPEGQISGLGKARFPLKKVLVISLTAVVIIGGASGAWFWWQTRGQALPAPTLGAPVEQAKPAPIEPAKEDAVAPNGESSGNLIKDTYTDINQSAMERALNPLAAPSAGSGTEAGSGSSATTDTDQDGLSDAQEFSLGTNPRLVDSEGDGLSDWEEVSIFGTNPLKADTDGDGYPDGEEVQNGYNPKGPGKLLDFEKAKQNVIK